MADAEQYLSCDSCTARSTAADFRLRPVTTKWKLIFVKTFGSVTLQLGKDAGMWASRMRDLNCG